VCDEGSERGKLKDEGKSKEDGEVVGNGETSHSIFSRR